MISNYICALDISSTKISAAVAEIKKKRITNIFFETLPSRGINRGEVVDSLSLISSIESVLKNLKNKSRINIKFIYANISGANIITRHSHAIIPLAERGNKVITLDDIRKVNEQARILGSSLEEEIIHRIAHNYAIDSNNDILNPLGLYSHKLQVDLYLICSKLTFLQNLTRAVNHAGYEIKNLFFSGLATSKAIFSKEFKERQVLFCDIGADITELLLFKDGILKNVEILSLGGDDLTLQLQEALKVSFDLAEDIKRSHANVGDYSQIDKEKEILIKQNNVYKPIKQGIVSEILNPKAEQICNSIKDAVEKMAACNKINHFVAVGRTVMLEGFLEMLENKLKVPVKIGRIADPGITSCININKDNFISGQKYLAYVTSLGIICQALYGQSAQILPAYQPTSNPILNTINKFKEIYQEYF